MRNLIEKEDKMLKKVCIVTSSRAEYGTLRNLIAHIVKEKNLELCLIVTSTHLIREFGYTISEIEADGFPIAEKIDIMMMADTRTAVSKTMGMAMILFADMFSRHNPDIVVLPGDRYEMIPIACCAVNEKIPIAHISGGETTEGAVDEVYRHCLTKMSYLHFAACETYRERIIQLGESPERVFNIGDFGVESIHTMKLLERDELAESLSIPIYKPYAVVTFHPVTLEKSSAMSQLEELLNSILKMKDMLFIITKSNADEDGRKMNLRMQEFCEVCHNCYLVDSLGSLRYLSAVKHAEMVIGNSSSGIIEAPTLKTATINIGDRQKGRLKAESIIDCEPQSDSILAAMGRATSEEFKKIVLSTKNPYGDKDTTKLFMKYLNDFLNKSYYEPKKVFYDMDYKFDQKEGTLF